MRVTVLMHNLLCLERENKGIMFFVFIFCGPPPQSSPFLSHFDFKVH